MDDKDDLQTGFAAGLEKARRMAEEQERLAAETHQLALRQLNTRSSLFDAFQNHSAQYRFKPGDLVTWKKGLRNRSVHGPFVILDVLDIPVHLDNPAHIDPTSVMFMERLDVNVLMRTSEDMAMSFMLDSRRLEPYLLND